MFLKSSNTRLLPTITIITYLLSYFVLYVLLEVLSDSDPYLSGIFSLLSYVVFALPLFFKRRTYFKVSKIKFKDGLFYTSLILFLVGLSDFVNYLLKDNISINYSHFTSFPYLFTYIIISPIFEEIIFRVIVIEYFLKKQLKVILGIVFSALIYSICHNVVYEETFVLFVLGLILGFIYYRSRNIWLVIGLHALYNLLVPVL